MAVRTLIGIFLESVVAHRNPEQFLRKVAGRWEAIPAEAAQRDVASLGLALRDLGVQRGDRVALLSENRYEWPVTDLAVLGIGATLIPIYATLTPPQVRHILENAEVSVVVVSNAAQVDKVRAAAAGLAGMRAIVAMEGAGAGIHAFDALLERGRQLCAAAPDAFRESAGAVRPDDLATIIYTSGTTGEPKGAMLSHGNIASNVHACLEVVPMSPADRCLSFLPLCHIFERMAGLYAMLAAGVSIAYAESMDTVAANAVEVRPTILCGVPRFFEKVHARVMDNVHAQPPLRQRIFHWGLGVGTRIARARFERRAIPPLLAFQGRIADRLVGAKIRARVGGRIRFCISGGAPLSAPVMEFFFAMNIPIHEGYGLTETSPVICLNPPGREKPGAVGPPIPGVEVRIGAEGEVLTRGPHVMRGYYRNDEATRAAITDGWFHTGDVGVFDDDGYLVITDRLKDLLVTAGGKKVAPQPIEARLKVSPWISEAVLLGDRRPFVAALLAPNVVRLEAEAKARGWAGDGQAPVAERPEARALFQAAIDEVNVDLAQFERIKQFAVLDRELSQEAGDLTPTLKVKRRVVNQKYAAIIERLYATPATGHP